MAEVDPGRPQVVNPELSVDLTRLLQIRGPLGVLNVLDVVVPVVSLGDVVTPSINIRGPTFRSTDIFSAGFQAAPPVNTVLADTLALPAGIYDVVLQFSYVETTTQAVRFQHRNAANAANLMEMDFLTDPNAAYVGPQMFPFAYELATNERLRFIITGAGAVGSFYTSVIFARIR